MNVIKYQLPRFLARGLQFSWQNGEELANWTGTFNFTDDGAVKSGSDTGTRYQHQREWLQRSRALHMNHKCGHRLYEQTGLQFALAVRYCSPRHIRCWGCPSAVLLGMPKCCAVFPLQGPRHPWGMLEGDLCPGLSYFHSPTKATCHYMAVWESGTWVGSGECPSMLVLMQAEHTGKSDPRLSL